MKYYPSSSQNGYFYEIATTYEKDLIKDHVTIIPSSKRTDPEYGDEYSIIHNINDLDHSFHTDSVTEKQWILFNLKDGFFALNSYTLIASKNTENSSLHLKNWRIYGSGNQKQWYLLDEHNNSVDLNGPLKENNFTCQFHQNMFFKYFLLYQHDVGFTKQYGFGLRRIDFFGGLIQRIDFNHLCECTKIHEIYIHLNMLFISIFVS